MRLSCLPASFKAMPKRHLKHTVSNAFFSSVLLFHLSAQKACRRRDQVCSLSLPFFSRSSREQGITAPMASPQNNRADCLLSVLAGIVRRSFQMSLVVRSYQTFPLSPMISSTVPDGLAPKSLFATADDMIPVRDQHQISVVCAKTLGIFPGKLINSPMGEYFF